ncbi:hypothetical protein ACFZC6_09075 [Streptomyces ossamyceticus]|uniref:hypothetical protein n=1 Tax=Streptomyces ossamyceticus TaxID=249581 RepID=UPI0036E89ADA
MRPTDVRAPPDREARLGPVQRVRLARRGWDTHHRWRVFVEVDEHAIELGHGGDRAVIRRSSPSHTALAAVDT